MHSAPIRTIDRNDFLAAGQSRARFVQDLNAGLSETGFVFLANHGIPEERVQGAFDVLKPFFFGLSEAQRMRYECPGTNGRMGYNPFGSETGEFAEVPDVKHFFHVLDGEAPDVLEVPGFTQGLKNLASGFKPLSSMLLQGVALSLDLPENHFEKQEGDSLLRALHYPAHEIPVVDDGAVTFGGNVAGMCASKHTDINMLTLLFARKPGLQLLHGGVWLPVTLSDPNVLIVNCGDMLWHLTGGRYKSGMHRVVCEPGVDRFSIPDFVHLKGDCSLVPLAHLGPFDPTKFPFKTAGEFLLHRLDQILNRMPVTAS